MVLRRRRISQCFGRERKVDKRGIFAVQIRNKVNDGAAGILELLKTVLNGSLQITSLFQRIFMYLFLSNLTAFRATNTVYVAKQYVKIRPNTNFISYMHTHPIFISRHDMKHYKNLSLPKRRWFLSCHTTRQCPKQTMKHQNAISHTHPTKCTRTNSRIVTRFFASLSRVSTERTQHHFLAAHVTNRVISGLTRSATCTVFASPSL